MVPRSFSPAHRSTAGTGRRPGSTAPDERKDLGQQFEQLVGGAAGRRLALPGVDRLERLVEVLRKTVPGQAVLLEAVLVLRQHGVESDADQARAVVVALQHQEGGPAAVAHLTAEVRRHDDHEIDLAGVKGGLGLGPVAELEDEHVGVPGPVEVSGGETDAVAAARTGAAVAGRELRPG